MKLFKKHAPLFLSLMVAALLTACGGGGGGGGGTAAAGVTVVPALGAFSAGVRVEAYDPVTGLAIGDGATTDATGTAVIDLGTHASSFILKVSGSATAKYFEEGLTANGTDTSFTSNDVLLALVPASAAVTKGASIGVTPLTHMAAGFAVNSLSDLKVNIPVGKDAADVMFEALARARYITGLSVQNNSRGTTLNPLLAPSVFSATTKAAGINLSQAGGYYGLYLAELSKAVSTENTPRSSLDLAKSLFTRSAAMKSLISAGTLATNSPAVTDFLASADLAALKKAADEVGSGNSTFLNTCKTLPFDDARAFNRIFSDANGLISAASAFVPSANDLAQMVLDLTFSTDSKISKNLVSPFNETSTNANGC
jgi:hypothetical protein